MHLGTIVDVCIDRPSTHYEGGAWIDRCQALSWYTETLGGDRWLPAQATIAAAWTAAGSATGAVFQASATAGPLTSGRFYAATSATTATEVFRGIKREYPRAGVAWVAESGRVIGYDIGTGAMWRCLPILAINSGFSASCIAANNGCVIVGSNGSTGYLWLWDHASGKRKRWYQAGYQESTSFGVAPDYVQISSSAIVNNTVNDVAITTLENSPIDPATGMPVPTIAVATNGDGTYSVSVIKNDGIVANIASDSTGAAVSVEFDGKALKVIRSDGTVYIWNDVTGIATGTAPSQTLTAATVPALLGTVSKQATRAKGSSTGLTRIQRNPTTLANSMVATAAHNFATGFQIGDSRLATICAADGVTESVVGGTIPDRSVKNVSLNVNGTLTKTQVAAGAALCALSGFSAENYLQQPYSANHDYSTTGFSGVFWLKEAPNSAIEYILNRDSLTPAQAIRIWVSVAGFLVFELYDGTTTRTALGTVAVDDGTPKLVQFDYLAGTMNVYVNTALYATATGAALLTLNNASALLNVGLKVDGTLPLANGAVTLFRMSSTIPSSEQREQAYRDELPLFQPGAQCTLAGTSPAVTALAYDDTTDILHVGTSYGRSSFKNLLRVESEATTVGATTALAASGGSIVLAGTSAKLYRPEISFYE